jgi:hypothetical protein
MKKESNTIDVESVKLSIKPSIHEDSTYNPAKVFKNNVKTLNKENIVSTPSSMLKAKKLSSLGSDYKSKDKRITNNS